MTGSELLGGRYRLDRLVGEGAMGRVWQGYDMLIERVVAVKQLVTPTPDPKLVERALREARTAGSLNHPHVVAIHDLVMTGELPCVVMEYVDGTTLESRAEAGDLTHDELARIAAQVADGLAAAHEVGIVHRDVKPANVLLTRNGTAKLADFGIARIETAPGLTNTGTFIGTVNYLAPEVVTGGPITGAADMWSLGATLYTILEGRTVFVGENTFAVLGQLMHGSVTPPVRAGRLAELITAVLARDPAQRPTAVEVRDALGRLGGAPARPAEPEPAAVPPAPAPPVDPTGSVAPPVDPTRTVVPPVDPTQSVAPPVGPTRTVVPPVDPTESVARPAEPTALVTPAVPRSGPTTVTPTVVPPSRRRGVLIGAGVLLVAVVAGALALALGGGSGGGKPSGTPSSSGPPVRAASSRHSGSFTGDEGASAQQPVDSVSWVSDASGVTLTIGLGRSVDDTTYGVLVTFSAVGTSASPTCSGKLLAYDYEPGNGSVSALRDFTGACLGTRGTTAATAKLEIGVNTSTAVIRVPQSEMSRAGARPGPLGLVVSTVPTGEGSTGTQSSAPESGSGPALITVD